MNLAEEPPVNHGFDRAELAGETTLKAHAGLDLCFYDGLLDLLAILPVQGERLLNDEMFPGFGGRNRMLRVIMWIAAN